MIIYTIASEIQHYRAMHQGQSPSRIRVSVAIMDHIERDLRDIQLYLDKNVVVRGEIRITDVLIVVDDNATIGIYDK